KTGRKHQIRRHLKHLSIPIIGDVNHGDNQHNQFYREHFAHRRLMLFATHHSFMNPYSNESITIKAPLGEEMLKICKQLG
ncbi:tRNA pseudouridine(65) synthase TruC, partial [Pseudoalteromonas agarivorans]